MRRFPLILMLLGCMTDCHPAAQAPAPASPTNATALEADLEAQANAMEAQADAAADRNVQDALANEADAPLNATNGAQP